MRKIKASTVHNCKIILQIFSPCIPILLEVFYDYMILTFLSISKLACPIPRREQIFIAVT